MTAHHSRRQIIHFGSTALAAGVLGCKALGSENASPRAAIIPVGGRRATLTAAPTAARLMPSGGETPVWTYNGSLFPVLRMRKGETTTVTLHNALPEHTSIHWHGVRVPNAMDGVPYLTQSPVQSGQSFTYTLSPPDTGTFFFHPHCATAEQLGRGLAGVLIVDGDASEPFDDDLVLVLKDWRLNDDGSFLPFTTLKGAMRAGTYGTLRTVNGQSAPHFDVPASAHVRLRLINVDSTRIANIRLNGAPASIIAIDGNGVPPQPLDGWRLGPAMRLDLAVQTPASGSAQIVDDQAATPVTLATLSFQGAPKRVASAGPHLAAPDLPEPDLTTARRCELMLGAGIGVNTTLAADLAPVALPGGAVFDPADSLCLSGNSLWTLNGQSWPAGGHERLPPPLFSFRRGESVLLNIFNATPHAHPLHIHGHTMRFLSSTELSRPTHWADTILVMPNERITAALVCDNPGSWMIHCHVIEHQESGMMGWFRVS